MKQEIYRYTSGEVIIFFLASDLKRAREKLPQEIIKYVNKSEGIPAFEQEGYLERPGDETEESNVIFTQDLLKEAGIDFFFTNRHIS